MLTGEIKNKIDQIWNTFWSGGISNPLSVIEQITYLLFAKRLDDIHTSKEAQAKLSQTETELAALKKKLALLQEVKSANKRMIDGNEYTESQTRKLMIDVILREASWDPKSKNAEEFEVLNCMPTASGKNEGTGYVDYVLWGDDNKPLALVEAKKTKVDPQTGSRQAELYANCLEKYHDQRPIIYFSNGYKTWMWDDIFYPPREVQGFATKDELQWKINQRKSRQALNLMQPKPEIAGFKRLFLETIRIRPQMYPQEPLV